MNSKVNESFSAFLDGEASEMDVQRLLKALDNDPSILHQWEGLSETKAIAQNWPVVRPVLQQDIAERPLPQKQRSKWLRYRLEASVAAIACFVVVGLVGFGGPSFLNSRPDIVVSALQPSINLEQNRLAQQRLEHMLKQHVERASFSTGRAVVPSAIEFKIENTL